jgi:hypothetical protein
MTRRAKHDWDPPGWLREPIPAVAQFHDQEVEVYEGQCEVANIRLWRENFRTLLDLEQLKELLGKPRVSALSDDEIISYIIKQGLHKIPDLAESIEMNGVRVPLILSFKRILLDGNRRFLACRYLINTKKARLPNFTIVPVKCIAPHASSALKLKIIAEMNFLDQHKEEWPRNVRAKFAVQEFESALARLKDEDKAYDYIDYFLQVSRTDLKRFQAVLAMINEYVEYTSKEGQKEQEGQKARQEAERFGRTKFHLFEEFYNKALTGPGTLRDARLAKEAKELLYRYILKQELLSITNVREFAVIVRYEPSRDHLKKANGSFLFAKAIYDDFATPKKATARISRFCEWLENLTNADKAKIPPHLKERLLKAAQTL